MVKKIAFVMDKDTLFYLPEVLTPPVGHAVRILFRDFEKVLGSAPKQCDDIHSASVIIGYASEDDPIHNRPEAFAIRFENMDSEGSPVMHICGSDDLGIIYGLLYISREYLGVEPFWFWADKEPKKLERIQIPIREYISPEPRVRYRGWFVNDEVCLIGWTDSYPPPQEVWLPVFEALLRCGGNMVIPGTDLPRNGIHWELASEMGLYITQHHAEPLGAEMFFRAYPHEEPSYDKNRVLFEGLWEDAVRKNRDKKVIWALGFRGQGDCPFWEQDPTYSTPERRGELISKAIRRQYELVSQYVENPACATYLYGEITELYRAGLLDLPDGIIKIWADNGYGKMVSRRQGNHNPRVPSLPAPTETGPHGLYYHITFHDLQASNHLTMFPSSPGLVKDELLKAFRAGADRYLLLNSGNIKPHLYLLEIVSRLWNEGTIDIDEHLDDFCGRFFSTARGKARECYQDYFHQTIQYGIYTDDKAGEEFYHHPPRSIIGHWIRNEITETACDLQWATGEVTFDEQVRCFFEKLIAAREGWRKLQEKARTTAAMLRKEEAVFFRDHLAFQVELHSSGCKGFIALCQSYFAFREGDFPRAFVYASQSLWNYNDSIKAMAEAEHDRWRDFYRADWLTNVKSTIYSLETLRRYLRMHGDSPEFFLWNKAYLMPESEKKIYLENTHRKPLSDDDLARKLKDKFGIPDEPQ
ncbi:MAG TPA: glycosyl hydrolase 115 family protein [Bacillota bacterium]